MMAKYSIHAGHNAHVPGAHGLIKEEVVDRQIKDAAIKYLRAAGQTVYDDTDEQGKTQMENLTAITRKINAHRELDLAVAIHLNAGGGTGIEIYQYDHNTTAVATRILNAVCSVTGLPSRGIKVNPGLFVLRRTAAPAILIECGFVDSKRDADIVAGDTDTVGRAIAEGIMGKGAAKDGKAASGKEAISQDRTSQENQLLQRGDRGAAVRALQNKLIAAGYSVGKAGVDGIFGPDTEKAVKNLQRAYKKTVDGIAGPQTEAALKTALQGGRKNTAASAASAIVPYPGQPLREGSRGKNVARVQRALSVTADGIFGTETKAALEAYQRRHQLTVDGIVGPQTWNTLF